MKKLIFIFVCVCLITGCGKKEETYKHTTLEDYGDLEPITTSYRDQEGKLHRYAIVEKINEGNEVFVLYQVGDNDYIQVFGTSVDKDKNYSVGVYNNKVYIITSNVVEYILDEKTSSRKDLEFHMNDLPVLPSGIDKIEDGYIYFDDYMFADGNNEKELKCSLINYTCERVDE